MRTKLISAQRIVISKTLQMAEKNMKRKIGLWIDDNEAIVMILEDEGEEMRRIMSNVDQRVLLSSGALVVLEEDIQQGQLINRLREYYDEVVTCICEPDNIMATGTAHTAHRGLRFILANKRGK